MPHKQLAIWIEHGVKDLTMIGQYSASFRSSIVGIQILKMSTATDDQHLKTLVEQNSHQSVREMSQQEKKRKKRNLQWVLHELGKS